MNLHKIFMNGFVNNSFGNPHIGLLQAKYQTS